MNALSTFFDNLKEKLKAAWNDQQESALFLNIKEKFDSLPPVAQKLTKFGSIALLLLFLLWIPVSNFMDSVDLNSQFEDRRQSLKELLKIERDYSAFPMVKNPPAPMTLKAQMDQRILSMGIKIQQIKDTGEVNTGGPPNVQQRGIQYTILHLTLRQAVDVSYELEQTDRSLKLADLELSADHEDPHYYSLKLKLINFAPKAQAVANAK